MIYARQEALPGLEGLGAQPCAPAAEAVAPAGEPAAVVSPDWRSLDRQSSEAWRELGGQDPGELTMPQLQALATAGLGGRVVAAAAARNTAYQNNNRDFGLTGGGRRTPSQQQGLNALRALAGELAAKRQS